MRSVSLLALFALGCAHAPTPDADPDGSRGTRVTNPRVAPWAFYRGDASLLADAPTAPGDVVETECAHGACTARHRHLAVWQIASTGGAPVRTTATKTHPERTQRVALMPGVRYLVVAWTRAPLEQMPALDLDEGTRRGPHTQTRLYDDAGRDVGVVQWGRVEKVR